MTSVGQLSTARALVAMSVISVVVLLPAPARGEDQWSDPHPGVRHLHRTTATPWRIHVLVVDLCAPGIRLRATSSGERRQTVPSFASSVGADAAVNGDFFSFETYATSGLTMGSGAVWSDTSDSTGSGFVAFGLGLAMFSPPSDLYENRQNKRGVTHDPPLSPLQDIEIT